MKNLKFLNLLLSVQRDLIVGGQAVMEGVMMRTPNAYAVAVRRKDGSIAFTSESLPKLTAKYPLLKLPILRGGAVLIQSMALGIKALNFSSNIAHEDLELAKARENTKSFANRNLAFDNTQSAVDVLAKTVKPKQSAETVGSIVFALGFNILLFIVLPLLLTNVLFIASGWSNIGGIAANAGFWETAKVYLSPVTPTIAFNLIDGLIRAAFFLTMIFSLSYSKEINRVFEYHGAEHKAVFAWEHGVDLTVANAKIEPRLHPRCGTSFLVVVMMVAIALFSIVRFDSIILNLLTRIVLLPIVAGISYEIIKIAANKESSVIFKAMTFPGLMLQKITTQEPDETQLEVALEALKASLKLEPETV